MKISLKSCLGCWLILGAAIGLISCGFVFLNDRSAELAIEDEGVWLARSLGGNGGQFDAACRAISIDPPPIGTAFVENWREVNSSDPLRKLDIIAIREKDMKNRRLAVLKDLQVRWFSLDDLSSKIVEGQGNGDRSDRSN